MTLYFDKLIDRYIPTDSGWNFHPDNTALLSSTEIDSKLSIDQANPLPHEYKQLMYSNIAASGNAAVYYLDMITSKDSGELPTIERDLDASNAKAIKLAPNTIMIFRTNYPYNKDRLKKVLCRCRKATGATTTLHVGVIGIEDKAYKQPDGTYGNKTFYEVTVSGEITESYATYVGYILGTDSVENIESVTRPNRDPDYPAKLLDGTTDIALVIKTGSGEGDIYVDSIELQDTENALAELPRGKFIVDSLEGLTDDNKLSPVEKTYIKTMITEIDIGYHGALADGRAAGVSSTVLTTKWNALHAIVTPVLEDMGTVSDITPAFDTAFDEYYTAVSSLEEQIAIHTAGLIGGLDERGGWEVQISGGPTVKLDSTPITLSVILLKDGVDVTNDYEASDFDWRRVSSNTSADSSWKGGVFPTGKTLAITKADLESGKATFLCKFKYLHGESSYYFKTGAVAISEEVPGPQGDSSIVGLLTNDSHVVPTDSAGNNGNFYGCNTTVKILVGTSDDSNNWSVTATPTNVTGTLTGKTYTVETISADVGYVDFSATRSGYTTITLRFTVTRSKQGSAGAPATAYWLVSSVAAIKKSIAGEYTPTTITFSAKSKTGTSSPANYAGRFKISESTNGSTWTVKYTSSANEVSKTYTPSAGVAAINCELYLAGGVTTLIDQEVVPIVSDGATGADGNGIASIDYTYATSQTQAGVKSAYSQSMFTLSATDKYGWQKEVISYTDGTETTTEAIIAVYGDTGTPAPYLKTQYSVNGTTLWHDAFVVGDLYMRTSNNNGSTYSTGMRIVGENGTNGTDGNDGTDGNWYKFEFAKNTSTSTPPSSGWRDDPYVIGAGEYSWMRRGLVVPPATTPASWGTSTRITGDRGDAGDPGQLLGLNADTGVILFTARGVLVTEEIKLTIVSANIPIANVTISRSDAGALTKIDNYHYTLDCSTVTADTITVGVTATYLDKSYSSAVSITKYVDPSSTPYNFGGVSAVPNLLPNGGWLVTGDYFLWAYSNAPAGSTAAPVVAYPNLVKGEIYEYNGTAWVKSSNGDLVMTMFDSYAQLDNDYDTAVIGAAVIKKLVAIDAFIKNLNAENLTTGTGNGATGGFRFRAKSRTDLSLPYDETTNPSVFDVMYDDRKVFEVDSESGNVTFGDYASGNGLRWENSTDTLSVMGSGKFTGTMDHEALTTMDAVASQISVNFATKTAYYGQDLYNGLASIGTGAWVSATGTFDGIGFSRIARLGTTEQTAIIVDSSVPNDGSLQFISKYTGSVRFIFEARPGMVSSGTVNLYINGVLISSTSRNAFSGATVVTVDRNVTEGDIVRCTTSGNGIYFKMYIRGVGLVLDMGSRYVSIKTTHYYNDRFLSSSPVARDSNSYMTYNSAEGIIGALAALTPNRDYPTVSGSVISVSGGASKSVTSIMRSSETVVIKTSSGIVYLSASIQEGVSGYALSGTIAIDTSEASLRTLTVLPKQDNTHSLGSIGLNLYYADLFVSSLVGMISAFASSAAPSGWLECNGQAVSRSTYSKLYTAIGTTFGSGDGSTTFNVPDLRGEFIRGWSHGRSGVDDGRAIGSFQSQSIESHAHSYTITNIGGSYGGSGSGGHRNSHAGATTGYAGSAETRPRNIALMYCIKY